jgi:type IV secretory pathway VirJ component
MSFLCADQTVRAGETPPFQVPPFGTIRVYPSVEQPARVVILASGEVGWNREAQDLAASMAFRDCLVIGVDTREYMGRLVAQGSCTYPSADFENLSRFVQQKLHLSGYTPPILAGFSHGAALTYATLVQAPISVFAGGIGMGFCPEAPLTKGVCKGLGLTWSEGGKSLLPAANLRTPLVVLPLSDDTGCSRSSRAFLDQMTGVTVLDPRGGEGSGRIAWDDQLAAAFDTLSSQLDRSRQGEASDVKDLPLVEIPAEANPSTSGKDRMAVMISGDGGWAGLDREVGEAIAARGIPMVGFNSLKYFWTPRTPEKTAGDLARVIGHYLKTWKKEKLILIGYSFGADVLPFLVNRLPEDLRARTDLIVLLGPSMSAQFEFHLSNWFEGTSKNALPTLPEVKRMKAKKWACLYGDDESDSLCRSLSASEAAVVKLPGGHHFDGDYPALAGKILSLEGLR